MDNFLVLSQNEQKPTVKNAFGGTIEGSPNRRASKYEVAQLERELTALKVEKETWIEVVQRFKAELSAADENLNQKITEINEAKIKFCDEVNDFDDQFGILSSWWSAEMMSLQDPLICQNAKDRERKWKINEEVLMDIEKVKGEISEIEDEIGNLKKKIADDGETLLQIVKAEEEIKLQPFGPEFQSLRADVQASRVTCNQLEVLIKEKSSHPSNHQGHSKTGDPMLYADIGFPRDGGNNKVVPCHSKDEDDDFRQEQEKPRGVNNDAPRGCQVFKMYETTTFVYKKQNKGKTSSRGHGYTHAGGTNEDSFFQFPTDGDTSDVDHF